MIYIETFGFLVSFVLVQIVIVKSTLPTLPPNPNDPKFTIQYLVRLKHPSMHSPYKKFGLTYDKFSVCELRYEQKISVCDSVLSSKRFRYISEPNENEYLDLSCRRRMVDLSDFSQITETKELLLSMYECPNAYKVENRFYELATNKVKFFIPIHFFIIGGYFRSSVVLSYKHAAEIPLPMKFHTVFWGISLEILKFLHDENRKEIYEKSTTLRKPTKPKIRRVAGKEGSIQRNHKTADAVLLSIDEIRGEKIYEKFMSTFKTVNICALKQEKKLSLCQQIIETAPYKLLIADPAPVAMFRCIRREVILLHIFAQSASTKTASFQCAISKEMTTNLFFLGSMLGSRGVIVFMQIPPFLQLLPDGVVNGINSEGQIKKPGILSIGKKKMTNSLLEDQLSVVNDSV